MPAIYTSVPVTGKSIASAEYEKRGLDKQKAARLGELVAVGLPHVRQLAYSGYVTNISAFLFATSVQKKVFCPQTFFNPKVALRDLLPFPIPPLVLSSVKALKTDGDKAEFAAACFNAEMGKFGQRDIFTIEKPTLEQFLGLPFHSIDINTPSPPNATSVAGFRTMLTTMKILTLFLSTHTYPAYTQENDTDHYSFDVDIFARLSTSANLSSRYIKSMEGQYASQGVSTSDLEKALEMHGDNMDIDSPELDIAVGEAVLVAKPAPFRPLINVGSPVDLPNLSGYVFPYFGGCFIPETDFLRTVMAEHFLTSLGDTKESAARGYASWSNGYEKWYKTDGGRQISHMFLGVKLALQSQSRLFILQSQSKYVGFALLGARFSIAIDGKVREMDNAAALREIALSLDDHGNALEKVCKILSETKFKGPGTKKKIIHPADFQNLRSLWYEVQKRAELEGDDWTEFAEAWDKVTFVERFWPMTHLKIAEAVSLILNESKEIQESLPLYMPSNLVYQGGRALSVMAIFGSMAPSFLDQHGVDYMVPGKTTPDIHSVIDPISGKRPLEFILVSGKRLEAAVDDFQNIVKKRRIRQNPSERAAGFRTIKFNGEARDMIWSALREMPQPVVTEKKKRGREDEDGGDQGEGTSKKKGKMVEDSVPFDVSDF